MNEGDETLERGNKSSFTGTVALREGKTYKQRRDRRKKLMGNRNGMRFSVRKSDGCRIRKSCRVLMYQMNINGVTGEHYLRRTDIQVMDRRSAMRINRESLNVVTLKKAREVPNSMYVERCQEVAERCERK